MDKEKNENKELEQQETELAKSEISEAQAEDVSAGECYYTKPINQEKSTNSYVVDYGL